MILSLFTQMERQAEGWEGGRQGWRNLGQLQDWFCLFLRKEHGEYVKSTENRVCTVRSVTVCMEFMSILMEFISGTLASCMAQTMH